MTRGSSFAVWLGGIALAAAVAACGGRVLQSAGSGGASGSGGTPASGGAPGAGCAHTLCGGVCCAGTCTAGRCLVTLYSGKARYGSGLAVDGSSVYWAQRNSATRSAVMKVPLGGGTAVTLASGAWDVRGLAIDASSVYWSTVAEPTQFPGLGTGAVMKTGLGGGKPAILVKGLNSPKDPGLLAGSVYFADLVDPVDDVIKKVPVGGGASVTVLSGETVPIGHIAVDASGVYFCERGTNKHYIGAVQRLPLGGGTPVTLAPVPADTIAVGPTSIGWTDNGPGTVTTLAKSGGTPLKFVTGQTDLSPSDGTPRNVIVVDASSVYWAEQPSASPQPVASVAKVPLGGGVAVTLHADSLNIDALAVDATSVYWITDRQYSSDEVEVLKLTPK